MSAGNGESWKKMKSRAGELILISFIVGLKLILSNFFPGLKTPGELMWTGGILLFYSIRTYMSYKNTGQ